MARPKIDAKKELIKAQERNRRLSERVTRQRKQLRQMQKALQLSRKEGAILNSSLSQATKNTFEALENNKSMGRFVSGLHSQIRDYQDTLGRYRDAVSEIRALIPWWKEGAAKEILRGL